MWPNQKVEQKPNWLRSQKYFEFSSPVFQAFCEGCFNLKCKPHTDTDRQNNEF
jgi:hypothetical protein